MEAKIFSGTKDKKTYGFYLEKSADLQNVVELTASEHMALIDGQSQGKVIVWSDSGGPSLQDPPPQTESELASQVRAERDRLITAIEWRISRYQQQSALGIAADDTAAWYRSTLLYVQELRDITKQVGFPSRVVWPELPA